MTNEGNVRFGRVQETLQQATDALVRGVDMVGLVRALVLDPALPNTWRSGVAGDPVFPKFRDPPTGGIAAWYTMRLTEIGENVNQQASPDWMRRSGNMTNATLLDCPLGTPFSGVTCIRNARGGQHGRVVRT